MEQQQQTDWDIIKNVFTINFIIDEQFTTYDNNTYVITRIGQRDMHYNVNQFILAYSLNLFCSLRLITNHNGLIYNPHNLSNIMDDINQLIDNFLNQPNNNIHHNRLFLISHIGTHNLLAYDDNSNIFTIHTNSYQNRQINRNIYINFITNLVDLLHRLIYNNNWHSRINTL